MRTLISLVAMLILLAPETTSAQQGYGQISLDNQTSFTANLYVDSAFGCGPVLARGFCTTQVKIGTHELEAKIAGRASKTKAGVLLGQGQVVTWKIEN